MAASGLASAQTASQKVALYANVGADLTHWDVDVAGGELIKRETITLPAGVQYAWPHASRRHLYVASSSSAPGRAPARQAWEDLARADLCMTSAGLRSRA